MIGEGGVYCYDAIGSYERELARASGSASALIQPFLDNQASNSSAGYLLQYAWADRCFLFSLLCRLTARTSNMCLTHLWNWTKC